MKNITVREYSRKESVVKYDSLLSSMLGKPDFCGKKFNLAKLSYHTVRSIERTLKNGKTFEDLSKVFQMSFGITDEEFYSAGIVDFYGARNFLREEMKRLMEQEQSLLKSDGVDRGAWEQAGGSTLEPFSAMLPLMKLGKIYSVYPFDLGHKPYNEIMLLLVAHKRSDSVEHKYSQLTKPKSK